MKTPYTTLMALVVMLAGCVAMAGADPVAISPGVSAATLPDKPFLLSPPPEVRPVVVRAHFKLLEIDEINDSAETFSFTGVLTLRWRDSRQAFDPAAKGEDELVFQGDYQFNEVSTGWYPQLVLVNEAGRYESSGVVLRVEADGSSTLIQTLSAVAKAEFDMRRFPFDSQRLEAVFEVLGFDRDEVVLEAEPNAGSTVGRNVRIAQWTIRNIHAEVRDDPTSDSGEERVSSTFVASADVERESFFMRRLVVVPLVAIVLLSFSVFWMDRSSIGDRLSVAFIGILSGVAYQIVLSDQLPRISYFTLMHGFVNLSFLTMCATVVICLVVSGLDRSGRSELGNRVDRVCRWAFPLVYFGLVFVMYQVAIRLY